MQNINIGDISKDRLSTKPLDQTVIPQSTEKSLKDTKVSAGFDVNLRKIDIDDPVYNKKELRGTAKELQSRLDNNQSELEHKNSMILAASGMTAQDFSKMKEDGYSPEDLDEKSMVTVADKIRIQLAKGGADISMMGDVSAAALKEAGGDAIGEQAIESAIAKASEINEITDDTKRYLIKNDLEPTIENVHKANFSVSEKYEYVAANAGTKEIDEKDFEALKPQLENVINKAGLAINEDTLNGAKWLLSENLPVTTDTITSYMAIESGDLKTEESQIKSAILETISFGKEPEKALIISGFSPIEKAEDAIRTANSITDTQIENAVKNKDSLSLISIASQDTEPNSSVSVNAGSKEEYEIVSARRSLEEIRLTMTFSVSVSMTMRGMDIGTTALSDLVDRLKDEENRLYQSLFGDDTYGVSKETSFSEKVSIYEETNVSLITLQSAPAGILGGFKSLDEISLRALSAENSKVSATFKSAEQNYEALMTAPRKDMGDSIKKAFRNVDDILEDLGFEKTESNERAVRILGYNSLSITKESVMTMRTADEAMQKTFKNLTPGVVADMVKKGINPLDMSLDKLNEKIAEIKKEKSAFSDEEDYAEFLYKLDRQDGLTKEERDSFVGIYRLMHQVVESDGAVIGALLNQGADITMRNMMMAIRSNKHKNRETTIDDTFGSVSGFKRENLSITDQIEMAFQTSRMQDACEEVTPSKLVSLDANDNLMNMNPDQLASALENMEEKPEDELAYNEYEKSLIQEAVTSETKVYEALRQFDMPLSPVNLEAMKAFLADRNGIYRKVFSRTVSEEDLEKTPEELMGDIMKRFGEAVKRPEDMAKAQEKLAETAENVMKNMLVETEVDHVNIKGMRVALKQVRMLGEIGQKHENYTIPITVADENGTLNLKIVRGKNDENGIVDIAFNMDKTGPVNATFKAEVNGITGSIRAINDEVLRSIREMESDIADSIGKAIDTNVSINYSLEGRLTEDDIYAAKQADFETTTERTEISTNKLYTVARTFIDALGKISL